MVNVYKSQSPPEVWERADPLDFAWFGYASERMQNQYRNSKEIGPSIALRRLMEAEVRDQLAFRNLCAVGFRTMPNLSESQEHIPTMMFQSDAVKIDWEKSEISGLGRRFESVKVARLIDHANENTTSAPETPPPIESGILPKPKSRGGRKSYYVQARAVLEELYAEHPAYRLWPATRLYETFNERYQRRFTPTGDKVVPPISERALRDYISRYRRELAETDGN